jgi:cyclophilin family peptidyl-prolyl cis-trans isomerase
MLKLWSRHSSRPGSEPAFGLQPLEPRVVLDGTPDNPNNPVVEIQTSFGNIYVELFPDVAPITVDNFLGYVERDDYDATFFHRLMPGFVLQGGGWSFDEARQDVDPVEQQDQILNEFELSNIQWTVAMAKLPNDPNSATSQWFINLANNSENLDDQNGGFTVFGEVVGGRDVVLEIAGLRSVNLGQGFENVPVTDSYDLQGDEIHDEDLVFINDVVIAYDPALSLDNDNDATPGGSANGGNRTTVVLPNGLGRAIAYQQNGLSGGWTVVDLGLKSETSNPGTSPVTWVDPKDGLTYAAAISEDGLILYKNTTGTTWTSRNLNDLIANAELISSSLTVFVSAGKKVHIAGLTVGGDMMLFHQTGAQSGGEYTWTARNLSDTDLASKDMETPNFVSPLTSYVTSWNGLNIVGLDDNGDIQALWWSPAQDSWEVVNLSTATGAPTMEGTIAPYLTQWGAINLTGTDENGNVVVTWWTPGIPWTTSNLTELKDGPQLASGSVATYVTRWGGTSILGRNADGDIVVYWWNPTLGPGNWQIANFTDTLQDPEIPTGPTIGFASPSGVINIFGTAADGDLIRYWWTSADQWQWENVSSEAELV